MLEYNGISKRDAEWYFGGTLAINNEEGTVHSVSVREAPDRGYCYRVGSRSFSPEHFHRAFSVYKFPLGWVQVGPVAVFVKAFARRSTKKGYTLDDLHMYNPYAIFLRTIRSNYISRHLNNKDKDSNQATLNRLIALDNLLADTKVQVSREKLLKSRSMSGSLYRPQYLSYDNGIDLILNRARFGSSALSKDFALCTCIGTKKNGRVSILYREKAVGYASQDTLRLFPPFMGLSDQLKRQTNLTAEVYA